MSAAALKLPPGCSLVAAEKIVQSTAASALNFDPKICGEVNSADLTQIAFIRFFFSLRETTPTDAWYCITSKFPMSFHQIRMQPNFFKRAASNSASMLVKYALKESMNIAKLKILFS